MYFSIGAHPGISDAGERKYNDDTSSLEDTIDSIFSDETGTESGTHPELPLESEDLNESDLDWF